jgi:hypothetical protein
MHRSARPHASPLGVTTARVGKALVGLALGAFSMGCATPAEQLARAETHFQNRAYAASMANLEDLERNGHRVGMSRSERVRYDVARGLSHLNLNEREDARHWLALAREEAQPEPHTLTAEQRTVIDRVMTETDPLAAQGSARPSAAPSAAR